MKQDQTKLNKPFSQLLFEEYFLHIEKQKTASHPKDKYGNTDLSSAIIEKYSIIIANNQLMPFFSFTAESTLTERFTYIKEANEIKNETGVWPIEDRKEKRYQKMYGELKKAELEGFIYWDNGYLCFRHPSSKSEPEVLNLAASSLNLADNREFSKFPIIEIDEAVKKEENETLQILDTWLGDFFFKPSYLDGPSIEKWLNDNKKLKCQILVLNPLEEAFNLRLKSLTSNKDLKLDRNIVFDSVVNYLKILHDLQWDYRGRLEIRFYNDIPAINAYIFDTEFFYGHFFSFRTAKASTYQKVLNNEKSEINNEVRTHFKVLWDRNKSNSLILENIKILRDQRIAINTLDRQMDDSKEQFKQVRLPFYIFQELGFERSKEEQTDYITLYLKIFKEENDFLSVSCIFPDGKSVMGSIYTINERYYRCQFNYQPKQVVVNFVMPLDLNVNITNTAIFSLIGFDKAFCGLSIVCQSTKSENESKVIATEKLMLINSKAAVLSQSFWFPATLPPLKYKSISKLAAQYQVYSYGRNDNNKAIRIETNIIQIMESGYALYKKKEGVFARGTAYLDEKENLHIDLFELKRNLGCHFIFHTNEKEDESDNLMCGLYLGISQTGKKAPKAVRVVLKRLPSDAIITDYIDRIEITSEKYKEIDEGIKKALTGRLENFLNWPTPCFNQEKLSSELDKLDTKVQNIFALAACYDIIMLNSQDDSKLNLTNLEKAIKHGFTEMDSFEKKIKKIDRRMRSVISGELLYSTDKFHFHDMLTNSKEYKNLLTKYGLNRRDDKG